MPSGRTRGAKVRLCSRPDLTRTTRKSEWPARLHGRMRHTPLADSEQATTLNEKGKLNYKRSGWHSRRNDGGRWLRLRSSRMEAGDQVSAAQPHGCDASPTTGTALRLFVRTTAVAVAVANRMWRKFRGESAGTVVELCDVENW